MVPVRKKQQFFKKPEGEGPVRLASLAPSNTEILHSLGLSGDLVAVDDYSDYPAQGLEGAVRLGPDLQIDIEKLKASEPDLVLSSLSVPGMERVVEQVDKAGLPQIVLNPATLDDVFRDILVAARTTGVEDRGLHTVSDLRGRVEAVRKKSSGAAVRSIYWEWWPKPFIGPGADNWLTEVSRIAGGRNIGEDFPGSRFTSFDGSEIIARSPDIVAAVWCGVRPAAIRPDRLRARAGWENVPAVRNNRILILDEGLYCRPSPRLVDGLEELFRLLHEDADPPVWPRGQ